MVGRTLRLGRVFGIEIKLDHSWFIIFILVAWSLAAHYFPMSHPGWTASTYWALGIATSLLLFASVLAHELGHSLVSQAYGNPVRDITLFIFGGAAHMSREPARPRHELWMALAGPATSFLLAALFGLLWRASAGSPGPVHALSGWLAWINLAVGLFNLIPGFPLDGGRVFRATVWSLTGNLERATRTAAGLGRLVAFGFIFFGVWLIFRGNWANGLWIAFIGWFLDNAAAQSVRQLALRELLSGHAARDAMMADCPHVARSLSLDVAVNEVLLPSGRRCFPVVEDGQLYGLLTLHQIKSVPRERWPFTSVGDVMIRREDLKIVRPEDSLWSVFERMATEDVNQYPVMENGRLLGMVTRDRLLGFVQTQAELA